MQHRTDLDENGARLMDELDAILSEHLPPELLKAATEKVQALQDNALELADLNDRRLYRALIGFLPEHAGEIHAAIAGTLFDGSVCDQQELYRWADGVDWAITPAEALRVLDPPRDDSGSRAG